MSSSRKSPDTVTVDSNSDSDGNSKKIDQVRTELVDRIGELETQLDQETNKTNARADKKKLDLYHLLPSKDREEIDKDLSDWKKKLDEQSGSFRKKMNDLKTKRKKKGGKNKKKQTRKRRKTKRRVTKH